MSNNNGNLPGSWRLAHKQDKFAQAVIAGVYAPIELLVSSQAVGVMMFGIGFAAAAIVYFVKVSKWMASNSGDVPANLEPVPIKQNGHGVTGVRDLPMIHLQNRT